MNFPEFKVDKLLKVLNAKILYLVLYASCFIEIDKQLKIIAMEYAGVLENRMLKERKPFHASKKLFI